MSSGTMRISLTSPQVIQIDLTTRRVNFVKCKTACMHEWKESQLIEPYQRPLGAVKSAEKCYGEHSVPLLQSLRLQRHACALWYLEVLWLSLPEFQDERFQATELGQLQEVESALLHHLCANQLHDFWQ